MLILVLSVALAIALSIIQKSLVDVSTSTKVEQSSRAFSAAEAGIEKALQVQQAGSTMIEFQNNSKSNVIDSGLKPSIPGSSQRQEPLEFPPLSKEEVVQVWLADFDSNRNPPDEYYKQPTLDVYWGNSATDQAALELTLIYHKEGKYQSKKWYLDHSARPSTNSFEKLSCSGATLTGYQCQKLLTGLEGRLILLRARLLYNTISQPFAVQAAGNCGRDCSLPPQARIFTSTGTSGDTQRTVKLFQQSKVIPPYFDYAIFSVQDIEK